MHPPNQLIAIPNLCSSQVQTEYQLVSAVADPFALEYRPILRGGRVDVDSAVDFGYQGGAGVTALDVTPQTTSGAPPFPGVGVTAVQAHNINNGNPLLSIPPIRSVEWWHLTIWAQEVIRDFTDDPNISTQEVVRAARQVSMLKARVRWTEFPSLSREILIDIGAGIDLFVGPTNQMFSVEIMVPDPASAPPVRPIAFTTSAPVGSVSRDPPRFRLDSWVVASAWCVYGSVGRSETRFTQSALVSSPGPNAQPAVDIPIPDNARLVQVFSTNDGSATPNLPVIWGFENPVIPPAPPPPEVLTPLGEFNFVGSQTDIVQVPQTSKFIRVRESDLDDPETFTAVFQGQQ